MAGENDIPIKIDLDVKEAQGNLDKFEKSAKDTADGASKAFSGLKLAIGAAVAFLAGRELIGAFEEAIAAASESDQVVQKLNISLGSTGEFSQKASEDIQDFAAALQQTTVYSDEAVISAVALAKNFGITNDQAKKLTTAAIQLSAATGDDLNTSVNKLGATYSGAVGKLAKLAPELKKLSVEQAQNGAVIDILNAKYDGFAQGLSQTFDGAIKKTKNNFGDIFESIGKAITQNPIVIASIDALSQVFFNLAKFIDKNKQPLIDFVADGLKAVIGTIPTIIDAMSVLTKVLKGISTIVGGTLANFIELASFLIDVFEGAFRFVAVAVNVAISSFLGLISLFTSLARNIPSFSKGLKALGVDIESLDESVSSLAEASTKDIFDTKALDSTKQSIDNFKNSVVLGTGEVNDAFDSAGKGLDKFGVAADKQIKSILGLGTAATDTSKAIKNNTGFVRDLEQENLLLKGSYDKLKGSYEGIQKEIEKQTNNVRELASIEFERNFDLAANAEEEIALNTKLSAIDRARANEQIKNFREIAKAKRDTDLKNAPSEEFLGAQKAGLDLSKTISRTLTGGADGLAGTITGAISGATSVIGAASGVIDQAQAIIDAAPGIINKTAKLLDSVTDLPDAILSAVQNLARAIPRLITEFIPNLVRVLPQLIKDLMQAIFTTIPEAIQQLAEALPDLVLSLVQSLEELIPPLIEGLVKGAPQIAIGLIDAFITKGGAIKIAVGITKALANPQLYLNIARGILSGLQSLGNTIANQFKAGLANFGKSLGGDFMTSVKQGFVQIFAGIGQAFAQGGQAILGALSTAFTSGAQQLYQGLVNGAAALFNSIYGAITGAFASIGGAVSQAFSDAATKLQEAIQKPFDDIKEFFKNLNPFGGQSGGGAQIGGGSGIIPDNVPVLGRFASGGVVPSGFPNDSFPASLTSGELVIPQNDVSRLSQFLDNQSSGGSDALTSTLLSQILQALQNPMTVQTTAEVNGRGFADIMLSLSRNNARTAA